MIVIANYDICYFSVAQLIKQPSPYNRKKWVWVWVFIADHPFVFVHCQVRICDPRNPGSRCAQGCIKEATLRRDVSDEDKLYPLAQGPLTIASDATEVKSRKRSNKKGTCSFNTIIHKVK